MKELFACQHLVLRPLNLFFFRTELMLEKVLSCFFHVLFCNCILNIYIYINVFREYQKNEARRKFEKIHGGQEEEGGGSSDSDDDVELDGGMKVPGQIWKKLYALVY